MVWSYGVAGGPHEGDGRLSVASWGHLPTLRPYGHEPWLPWLGPKSPKIKDGEKPSTLHIYIYVRFPTCQRTIPIHSIQFHPMRQSFSHFFLVICEVIAWTPTCSLRKDPGPQLPGARKERTRWERWFRDTQNVGETLRSWDRNTQQSGNCGLLWTQKRRFDFDHVYNWKMRFYCGKKGPTRIGKLLADCRQKWAIFQVKIVTFWQAIWESGWITSGSEDKKIPTETTQRCRPM